MRFWDTSAVVPLLGAAPQTGIVQRVYPQQPAAVWWATVVECASAIARLEREGAMTASGVGDAYARLDLLRAAWLEIEPTDDVRHTARRMLRVHSLRAADALQLAAAFVASEGRPPSLPLASLDDRLRLAAAREGFPLVEL